VLWWGLERISVILCSGGNVNDSVPGVSLMTIIGPWRMDASAYINICSWVVIVAVLSCSIYCFQFLIYYFSRGAILLT